MPGKRSKRKDKQKMNESPYSQRRSTYLQGTLLKWFDEYCKDNDIKPADFMRQMLRDAMNKARGVPNVTGIIKVNP